MSKAIGLAVAPLAALVAALAFTAAGVLGDGANPLRHEARVPAVAGDSGSGLAFPTVPPEADNCYTYTWAYRSADLSEGERPFLPLNTEGGDAWVTGFYVGDPVMNFDFEVPPDAEEVYVGVYIGEASGRQYAMRLGGYADGRWRGTMPVDETTLGEQTVAQVVVCWKTGAKPVTRDTRHVGLADGVANVAVGGGEAIAGGKAIVLPSQANASQDSASYVLRLNAAGIQSTPLVLDVFDQAAAPVIGVDGHLLLPPEAKVVGATGIDGARTAFLVRIVTTAAVWNPTVTLSGFPNGGSFAFPAPKLVLPSDPVHFSLNLPDNLIGTWTIESVRANVSGGANAPSAPAGAAIVYGQSVVEAKALGGFDVIVPLCNPTPTSIILTNAGIDAWHFDPEGEPDAGIFGTYSGTVAPYSCEPALLDGNAARVWRRSTFDNVIAAFRAFEAGRATAAELAQAAEWRSTGSPAIR